VSRFVYYLFNYASVCLLVCASCAGLAKRADTSADVKAVFADPPREYSTAPLWTWNDNLTREQILESMRDLAEQNVKQVFVHPRPGLMTPYLSEKWFKLWETALDEAERLDMNVWIYDENSYPSGFAGGHVPDQMPEASIDYFTLEEVKEVPPWDDSIYAVFSAKDDKYENITQQVRAGSKLPKARYFVSQVRPVPSNPWFGGKTYVTLIKPGVTEKFLEITLEPYRRRFAKHFGKRLPGVFTDEPEIYMFRGMPWADHLPEAFEKRWGYSLIDNIPSLFKKIGEWKRVRHNYFQLLNEQFIQNWGKPYYEYCDKYGLEFTGHYFEHCWPWCLLGPDSMSMYAWQHRPGIDMLMNYYDEGYNAHLGNVRIVKELSSVANQLGAKRTLCEAYGAGGWDLRFEDMKRIGDFLYVLGVNTLDEHYAPITMRGSRKRDHPQYFSYQAPWWDAYHISATYFARLSAALSHGREVNEILVIEPTTTVWMYQTEARDNPDLQRIGRPFQRIVVSLSKSQVEYDIGSEYIIEQYGSVDDGKLVVGEREYKTVVITPFTENLNAGTVKLLENHVKQGGNVLCCGDPPALVDGRPSERLMNLSRNPNFKLIKAGELPEILKPKIEAGFSIRQKEGDKGILFHRRHRLDDGELLFLVNTSIESAASGTIYGRGGSIEQWDLHTGEIRPYVFLTIKEMVSTGFELPPCGSLLLFFSNEQKRTPLKPVEKCSAIAPAGSVTIKRLDPNVLTIDYVDVAVGKEKKPDTYFFQAADFVFKKHGLQKNPWERAVQFKDELIKKTFPPGSGFEAAYKFKIEQKVPDLLFIAIERPDLYSITCNGAKVTHKKGDWWVDKSFGKIDITAAAKVGPNKVTITASPMTMYHELEPAYLLGNFSLRSTKSGFVLKPDKQLALGPWNEQGHQLYGHKVSYKQTFNLSALAGKYRVSLPGWYGSVAEVLVNGKKAGYIAYAPWECEVTEYIKAGNNVIEVIVIGTTKNTFGPHHGNPPLGRAWPAGFAKAPKIKPPGDKYSTVGYGLFEPFVLNNFK